MIISTDYFERMRKINADFDLISLFRINDFEAEKIEFACSGESFLSVNCLIQSKDDNLLQQFLRRWNDISIPQLPNKEYF